MAAPLIIILLVVLGVPPIKSLTPMVILAFIYLGLGSSLIAFFAWYRALAVGGIAKVGQIQLLQPILTMLFASVMLGEPINPAIMTLGFLVAGTVFLAQKSRVTAVKSPVIAGGRPIVESSR